MKIIITIIRIAIGWHFLYEGFIKLFADEWSAAGYLNHTYGSLSGFYHWLAASPGRLAVIDFLNVWGLIAIGLSLFLGIFSRIAALFGAMLLVLYYFAYPPFGITLLGGSGNVYIINTLLIEAAMLVFFFCYKENGYGFDNAVGFLRRKTQKPLQPAPVPAGETYKRRELLKDLAALPVLGFMGWSASRTNKLYGYDTLSGATIQINQTALGELKGELPKGKIGGFELSRLCMGGNLIGGWSHARDLLYVDQLFKAYNTERKIFETLMLCEQSGINCINIGYPTWETMVKYRKVTGSNIKVIIQVGINDRADDIYENITESIDNGMDIIQLQGNWADRLVRDNRIEVIAGFIDRVRSNGYVAGLGAHSIYTMLECEKNGIIPDYYMITMHHDNYWSAHPRENRTPFEVIGRYSRDRNMYHDNLFCTYPDETIEFVNRVKIPVMGFKVLAAGSIRPQDGFRWAFENGADFICVGMFDYQVVEDVNICLDVLNDLPNRQRGWYA